MTDTNEEIVTVKKPAWYKRFWNWILILFKEEFELTVWYVYETTESAEGLKVTKRKEKNYILKEISKKTNTHIKGKDISGADFEIKTVDPFDYEIRKTK